MTDNVQQQITWLRCFDDDEADHVGAARCANTMESQQARIELLGTALTECSNRLESCIKQTSEPFFAKTAVEAYRALCEPSTDSKALTEIVDSKVLVK